MTTLAQQYGFTDAQLRAIALRAVDLLEAGDPAAACTLFEGLLVLDPGSAAFTEGLRVARRELAALPAEAEAA